jgi:outer membrane protein OmpA-like peptidoglycan-associated protein
VFLNQYPDTRISLGAHTDVRASNQYNERLAQQRVRNAREYLLNAGIPSGRLEAAAFGEEKPFTDCTNEDCEEQEHQYNRRTEILIIRD